MERPRSKGAISADIWRAYHRHETRNPLEDAIDFNNAENLKVHFYYMEHPTAGLATLTAPNHAFRTKEQRHTFHDLSTMDSVRDTSIITEGVGSDDIKWIIKTLSPLVLNEYFNKRFNRDIPVLGRIPIPSPARKLQNAIIKVHGQIPIEEDGNALHRFRTRVSEVIKNQGKLGAFTELHPSYVLGETYRGFIGLLTMLSRSEYQVQPASIEPIDTNEYNVTFGKIIYPMDDKNAKTTAARIRAEQARYLPSAMRGE